ncbi:MAG: hypothetical protein FWC96_07490 [Oscillospiraceae bacterium]|nr:hypothetical protein [Oscillospiraceae bacterium]
MKSNKRANLGNALFSPKAMRDLLDGFSAPKIVPIKKGNDTEHKTIEERLAGFDGEHAVDEWDTDPPVRGEVF